MSLRFVLPFMCCLCLLGCGASDSGNRRIRIAIENQMRTYPLSTLRDLYKNFFQDRFGPGHIVSDTAAAGAYLREELATAKMFEGAAYEPTGSDGNFVRVNLSVVKKGQVAYDTFFDAFVRSVNGISAPTVDEWKREWHKIMDVIKSMDIKLTDFAADSLEIEHLLDSGHYVMHHSRQFEEAYEPHYRIVERRIFEKEILPLIDNNK